jgi:hypothetical protein
MSAHYVEETAIVYLRLSADGKRWDIDDATLDGQNLFGYDNGPQNANCECDAQEECNRLAANAPAPPEASDLLELLAKALGYAVVSPDRRKEILAWESQAMAELERLDEEAEVSCDYSRRDSRAFTMAGQAWDTLRTIIEDGDA